MSSPPRTRARARLALPLVLLFPACGPEQAVERGQALFSDPKLSPTPSNVFSCATCHAVVPEPPGDGRRLPGHTLYGAAARPSFWGGGHGYLLDAVSQCLVDFMRGEPLTEGDPSGRALLAYLQSLAPSPEPARPCTVVRDIDAAYLGALPPGDGARGQAAYREACAACHGEVHTGAGRIGPGASVLPDDTIASFGAEARAITAEKVRHGKYFGIAGRMPLYCTERFGDGELADVLAYLLP